MDGPRVAVNVQVSVRVCPSSDENVCRTCDVACMSAIRKNCYRGLARQAICKLAWLHLISKTLCREYWPRPH